MEDGELEFSNQEVFSSSEIGVNCSMDSFFDGLLMDSHNAACTHTHTCNPTGPENTMHTHTCFHVHTKILPEEAESDEKVSTDDTAESCGKKRPLGNREAVRKYREKKKAKAASLEDEVSRLTAMNQVLLKRLQSQASLEAENARLKCLLVDLRGRIEGEIGAFPYQKPPVVAAVAANNVPSFSHMMNPCNVQCDDEVYCLRDGYEGGASINDQGLSGCGFDQLRCAANQSLGGNGNGSFNNDNASVSNKRRGGHRAPKAV